MSTRSFKRKNVKATFCQGFCEHREVDFLRWLERSETCGKILKDDRKAILLRSQYDGRDLVIKHYKYVGVLYALIHAFTKSRAQHSWQASLKMAEVNVPTPLALACVEHRRYGVVTKSYYVYKYEEGTLFREYAWSTPIETILAEPLLHQVYRVLRTLKIHKVSHGDLKTTNIIITEHGPSLIDLDQVRCHTFKYFFAKRRLRDLKRFRRELPWNR